MMGDIKKESCSLGKLRGCEEILKKLRKNCTQVDLNQHSSDFLNRYADQRLLYFILKTHYFGFFTVDMPNAVENINGRNPILDREDSLF